MLSTLNNKNEVDLNMLGNTLNSLDSVSKSAIPSLAPGSAIFTGTSFPLPVMVHIDQLDKRHAPSSDNANFLDCIIKVTTQKM
ncbi:hypothetical protein SNK12g_30970 [Lactiplantibacillus plantarum]